MATLPYSGVPSVSATTAPALHESISATPADFGGMVASAEQTEARDEATLGQDLARSAVATQEVYNRAVVQHATNQAMDVGNTTLYDPKKGYLVTQGRHAMDGYGPAVESIKSQFQNIRDGLANDAQRAAFDTDSRRYLYYYQREAGTHADQQAKAWYTQTDHSTLMNGIQTSASSWNNDGLIQTNVDRGHSALAASSQRNGWDAQTWQFKTREFESSLAMSILRSQALTDPAGALERYNSGFLPGPKIPDPAHPGQLLRTQVPFKDLIDDAGKESFIKPLMNQAQDAGMNAWVNGQIGGAVGRTPARRGVPFTPVNLPADISPEEDAMVRTISGEAGRESLTGQQAVAHVILNRARGAGVSARDVVFAPNQFEPWNGGEARARLEAMSPASPEYQRILNQVVRPAVSGQSPDPTSGATHFYAPKAQADLGREAPSWAQGAPTIIGNHNFYKLGYGPGAVRAGSGSEPGTTGAPDTRPVSALSGGSAGDVLPPPDFEGEKSPAEAAMPDREELVRTAIRAFPNYEDQLKVVAKIDRRLAVMQQAVSTEKKDFMNAVGDLNARALNGGEINYSEAHIRHIMPPAEAANVIEKLRVSQDAGQYFKGAQWAAPEQVTAAYNHLSAGLPADTRGVKALQSATHGLIDAEADLPPPTEDQASPEQYRYRRSVLNAYVGQMQKRNQMLANDAHGYVMQHPLVQAAADAARADPRNQTLQNKFFQTSLDVQSSLGVPSQLQHVMSRAQAQSTAGQLLNADPSKLDVGATLAQMEKAYGPYWNQAFGDIKTMGKLAPDYQVLAMTPSPAVRDDMQRMLKFVHEKGGVEKLHDLAGKYNMASINDVLSGGNTALQNFISSVNVPGIYGNAAASDMMKNAIRNLAAYRSGTTTVTGTTAARQATSDLIDDKYDFGGRGNLLRVPKGLVAPIENYADTVMFSLNKMELAGPPGAKATTLPGVTQSDDPAVNARVRADVLEPIQRLSTNAERAEVMRSGRWLTNEKDNGAFLVAQDTEGRMYQVRDARGKRVEFSFQDAMEHPNLNYIPELRGVVP